ncbi:MAG: hypothetical protein HFH13_06490 [Dorea sp.]|nr:hypothetical protein [Dorea sp.]
MFQVLPGNFFVPLSSPNKIVYWECICKLFSVMEHQLSFGVEREVLVDELQYYFEQSAAAEIVEEDFAGADSRGKANGILRRLEYYGWIEIETDKSYVQRVNFKEYSVRLMKTLLEIEEGKQIEYQGYIYTIYSLVRGTTDNPGVVLLQILENTDFLITGLKNLNSNIKHYIDELTKHSTVAEIMDALFNDYITNIVDKAYHRLLTSDNVSKFRPEIIERLESKSKSKTYIEKAAVEIAGLQEIEKDKAKEQVYRYLHEVIEAFRNMDDILNEINQKNTQYQRAAINRAKFLLSGNEDIRGQIKEILLGMNEVINEEKMDLGGIYEIEFLDNLVRIYSCSFLDENSFYSPIEGKKEFIPQQMKRQEPDMELRQEKMRRMMEKMQKILSPEKINHYVGQCIGSRKEMLATELPLSNVEDFVKIIYVRLYGQRKNMKYRIETTEEKEVNGFRFKDFKIWRK